MCALYVLGYQAKQNVIRTQEANMNNRSDTMLYKYTYEDLLPSTATDIDGRLNKTYQLLIRYRIKRHFIHHCSNGLWLKQAIDMTTHYSFKVCALNDRLTHPNNNVMERKGERKRVWWDMYMLQTRQIRIRRHVLCFWISLKSKEQIKAIYYTQQLGRLGLCGAIIIKCELSGCYFVISL
eukprot:78713_1